jgi:hypothetical protein
VQPVRYAIAIADDAANGISHRRADPDRYSARDAGAHGDPVTHAVAHSDPVTIAHAVADGVAVLTKTGLPGCRAVLTRRPGGTASRRVAGGSSIGQASALPLKRDRALAPYQGGAGWPRMPYFRSILAQATSMPDPALLTTDAKT